MPAGAVSGAAREEDRDVRSDGARPVQQLRIGGRPPTELICRPESGCCIRAATPQARTCPHHALASEGCLMPPSIC